MRSQRYAWTYSHRNDISTKCLALFLQISGFQTFRPNKESNEEIKTGGKRKFVFVDHKQVAMSKDFFLLGSYCLSCSTIIIVVLFDCLSSSPRHFVKQRFLFRRRKHLRRRTFRQKIMSLIMSAEQPQAISSNKQSDFSHYAIPRVISYQWFLSREAYINTRSIVDHISIRKKWLISRGISHKTLWELIPKKGICVYDKSIHS